MLASDRLVDWDWDLDRLIDNRWWWRRRLLVDNRLRARREDADGHRLDHWDRFSGRWWWWWWRRRLRRLRWISTRAPRIGKLLGMYLGTAGVNTGDTRHSEDAWSLEG